MQLLLQMLMNVDNFRVRIMVPAIILMEGLTALVHLDLLELFVK